MNVYCEFAVHDAAAIDKARAWEMTQRKESSITEGEEDRVK